MKKVPLTIQMLVLCLMALSSVVYAEQLILSTDHHPTKTIVTVWDEFQTTDGGLNNANVWANVWPSDRKIGAYFYTQVADPSFTQVYGGLAGRAFNGSLEGGLGLGIENADGDVGLRRSAYCIVTYRRFSSANWYESSHNAHVGWWMLSQDMYAFKPTFEAGFRLQRYLGGGPMVRYTAAIKRWTLQPYAAALYDGDRLNPLIALSVTYK